MTNENEADWLVFYDAECGFCRRILRIVLNWDRAADCRLAPVALHEPTAQAALAPMPLEIQMQSWHLQRPDGIVVSGGRALPELLQLVRRHEVLRRVLRKMPGLTESGYRLVAQHRVAFGRMSKRLPDYKAGE